MIRPHASARSLLRPMRDSMIPSEGKRPCSHTRLSRALRGSPDSTIAHRKSTPLLATGGLIVRVRHDDARRAGQ